jgi:hypothetical protein
MTLILFRFRVSGNPWVVQPHQTVTNIQLLLLSHAISSIVVA